jgi:hypothetical protein
MGIAVIGLVQAVIVAIIAGMFARSERKGKRAERRSEIRAEESRLSMAIMSAAIDLGLATAIAVSGGKVNGEMDRGREHAAKAQSEYTDFLERIAARQIAKD